MKFGDDTVFSRRLTLQLTPPYFHYRRRYQDRRRMLRELGPELARPTIMHRDSAPPHKSALQEIFDNGANLTKLRHYIPVYETFLTDTERMLEIGVDRGGSLTAWRKYLPGATIVGIDIEQKASRYDTPSDDIHVRIGDQTDVAFLNDVVTEFGPFDTILDDGGHQPSQMIESFRFLFPRLQPGGVYIVEDIHANYWTAYRDQRQSFIDFIKWLTDSMHAHYLQINPWNWSRFIEGSSEHIDELHVPFATTAIESISVFDSIVAIRRARTPNSLPRIIAH